MNFSTSKDINRHYIDFYLREPRRRISVLVIGTGGTGSFLIPKLARLDVALRALGHMGLFVTAMDNSMINNTTPARQAFSPIDIGNNKAETIITRVNRFYGLDWEYQNVMFRDADEINHNIVISCVDTVIARKNIVLSFREDQHYYTTDESSKKYLIDIGNGKDFGQIVLASNNIAQPAEVPKNIKTHNTLPDIFSIFDIENTPEDDTKSCSIPESLSKQGLFINELMAIHAAEMLKHLTFEYFIDYNVLFINLKNLITQKTFIRNVHR